MTEIDWNQVWTVFEEAIDVGDESARLQLIRERCGTHSRTAQEVLSLVEAHQHDSLLDDPRGVLSLTEGGDRLGPYEILEEIGRGGMGVVYRAHDQRLDRLVALKMLPPHRIEDAEARARFTAEARAAARLEHPNIATVYDIGEAPDGRVYFAMAYYHGETLDKRIERGPVPFEDAVEVVSQIAEGLDRAHAADIVHRDVKPGNILITRDGVVKILDFGIAKVTSISTTHAGAAVGTVSYMSPEQARGDRVDHRSDIWSLGVVLYEMLTGSKPFHGDRVDAVLYSIVHHQPQPPGARRADLPSEVDQVLDKALQKRPEGRFGSARDLVDALRGEGSASDGPRYLAPTVPERVRATVVVSQLVGYVQLVDRLVPRDLEEVVSSVRELAARVVAEYDGTLQEMDGESLIALFGIPDVHEDDFVRAVRAARDLHAALRKMAEAWRELTGCDLRFATGIDSGSIVARAERDRPTLRVTGETIQTARQLSLLADGDDILVTPECERLVRPFFETAAAGAAQVKGSNRTITPFRILRESGSLTRMEAARRVGLTDYAGRDRELDLLLNAHRRAAEGKGQTIAVLGEAGIGKSRLLYEFQRRVAGSARVVQGRCVPHAGKIPYLPFGGVLRDHLNLPEERPDETLVVERVNAVDESLEIFLPFYLHLLSVESDRHPIPDHQKAEDMRMAMVEALSGVFTLSARRQPLIMLLEDWHWADEASHEVLKQLAELAPACAMTVVVTYRPEYQGERIGHHGVVHLKPLGLEATLAMIRSVVGARDVPEELGHLVYQRTGGNPFFLEEMCRTLLEDGILSVDGETAVVKRSVESIDLPDSVQAVIRARIHRLGQAARRTLRVASVAGREFSRGLLQSVLPDETDLLEQLDGLSRLGLIQKTAVLPDVTYRFKHVLTQEVVYGTLLHHQRKALHAEIAEALEGLLSDRLDEHVDVFVHHFSRAEDWRRAAHYGHQAARRAIRLGQFHEAGTILDDAITSLRALPNGRERREEYVELLLDLERVRETTGDRARQQAILDELLALLQPGGDPAVLAEVHRRQGDLHALRRRLSEADRSLASAMELARISGDDDVVRRILRSLGFLRWNEGRSEEAVALNKQLLVLHRECGDDRAVMGDLVNLCIIARDEGRYEEALAYLEEGQEVMDRLDNPSVRAYAYHSIGILYRLIGNMDRALEYLEDAAAVAEEHRLPLQHSFDLMSMANIYLSLDRVDRSIEYYKQAIDLTRRSRYADGLAKALRVFGEVLLSLDRHDEALPYLTESADWFRKLEDRPSEAEMLSRLAGLYEARDEVDKAEVAWRRIAELLEDLDPQFEVDALEAFARLARKRGSDAEALTYYLDAIELTHRLDQAAREARLRNTAGILLWGMGSYEDALAQYERALPLFEEGQDDEGAGLVLNSIAACLSKLGRHDRSGARAEEALAVHRRSGQQTLEAHAFALIGDARLECRQTDDALDAFSSSLQLRWELEDRTGEGWMLLRMARAHAARGETGRARDYGRQAMLVADEINNRAMKEACGEFLET